MSIVRVAWDFQAITGPRPTGLGMSVGLLLKAFEDHCAQHTVIPLRPNETNSALVDVPDRMKWEQWRLPNAVRRIHPRASLLYSPALGAPLKCALPVVAHVHDLIPLIFPEQFHGPSGFYWKQMLPRSWKRARIITVSNAAVKRDIMRILDYPAERIHVVPYYPDPSWRIHAQQIREQAARDENPLGPTAEPVFLMLASHEVRKNIELAIQALAELKQRHGMAARLVCIGGHSEHTPVLQSIAAELGVQDSLELPGYLSQDEITERLLNCTALLFVSRYEGYGMPPQEAQSIGVPVVLSDIACHKEVYADRDRISQLATDLQFAPPMVDTGNHRKLADHMHKLATDPDWRELLGRHGIAYSGTFSSRRTATALLEAFEAALVR
ncbi:MAG: glycosyltransferase family 4 protein [Planctomycetales bacterium]|nr:glycosyltransferase family 4 protein [bacterium]UNM08414.1 MAG: glycosyltransferase family 4 protein [Planctomycetales bacterium]